MYKHYSALSHLHPSQRFLPLPSTPVIQCIPPQLSIRLPFSSFLHLPPIYHSSFHTPFAISSPLLHAPQPSSHILSSSSLLLRPPPPHTLNTLSPSLLPSSFTSPPSPPFLSPPYPSCPPSLPPSPPPSCPKHFGAKAWKDIYKVQPLAVTCVGVFVQDLL